jgi:hypothetical protein
LSALFRKSKCKCCKKETKQSCVDIVLSRVKYAAKALRAFAVQKTVADAINAAAAVANTVAPTSPSATAPAPLPVLQTRALDATAVQRALRSEYSVMSGMMCQECVYEGLKMDETDDNEEDFTMHPWACAHGKCAACENKSAALNLPAVLTTCQVKVKVGVWKDMERRGSSAQYELALEEMTVADLCKLVVNEASTASSHWLRTKYSKRAQRLGMRHMGQNAVHGSTDFAATVALTSKETGTVSKNNYANLGVWVLSHSPRDLPLHDEVGNVTGYIRVVTTDVWFFWGPTECKSKFNDSLFHNSSLDSITAYYKTWFQERERTLEEFTIWTDNCFAQYRGCRNLYFISQYFEKWAVRLHHFFGEVGQFKGPHDSAGKVQTSEIKARTEEGGLTFAPDAAGCFELSIMHKSVPKKAALYAALEKGPEKDLVRLGDIKQLYSHDQYFIGYVTSDKDEHTSVSQRFPDNSVLYVDRTTEIGKYYTPVKANQTFKSFRSTTTVGLIEHRAMPCCCDRCRRGEECRHLNISGSWQQSALKRIDISTPIAFETNTGNEQPKTRSASKVILQDGSAKVMGTEGALKSVNAGSIIVVVETDDDGASVGVIRSDGVLFYNLQPDGSYMKPEGDEKTLVKKVSTERYFVSSQVGCRSLPDFIRLNKELEQLVSEEAQLSFEPTEYVAGEHVEGESAEDEQSSDEEEEEE